MLKFIIIYLIVMHVTSTIVFLADTDLRKTISDEPMIMIIITFIIIIFIGPYLTPPLLFWYLKMLKREKENNFSAIYNLFEKVNKMDEDEFCEFLLNKKNDLNRIKMFYKHRLNKSAKMKQYYSLRIL